MRSLSIIRRRVPCFVLACACLFAPVGLTAAADFSLDLSVRNPSNVRRAAEPISGGVPLPKGAMPKDQPFVLLKEDGREVPCQTSPLVVETDGTLRWVLVDFQDDVEAGATNTYRLRAGKPQVQPAARLRVEDDPDAVTVDTGKLRFAVSKQRPFGPFDFVEVGGKKVVTGGQASYEQMQGRKGWDDPAPWKAQKLVAAPPDSVTLHYAGPLRVTLEVRGHFANDPLGAGYRAWITAWAGKGRLAVKYKLCNSNPDQYTAILVRRSTLQLQLAAEGPKEGSAGWIAAGGANPVFVSDRLFATNPPRRLAIDGRTLVLEGIAERPAAPKDQRSGRDRPAGTPWKAEGFWLYDCSHHSSEYVFDFDPPQGADELEKVAQTCHERLWVLAPGEHYSRCDVLGTGRFGTLEDEMACYAKWGWSYAKQKAPQGPRVAPGAFVPGEDNHGESEADSVQGLLLMYLRTGQRGWLDLAEAWARYHMDLQTWRTDGWAWKDGAIWFPTGGPQGNMPVRKKWNFDWGPNWGNRQSSADCTDLWRHAQSKSCYCHFYGSGLADYFCLTGDRDALEAARDNVEQKDDEFRRYRKFTPGKSDIGCTRGFGRGFEVMVRVLQADPTNQPIRDLCRLAARTLWESPMMDQRGFHPSKIGGGFGGMSVRELSPNVKRWMEARGIRFTTSGDTVDKLTKDGRTWPVSCMGGTWQHVYVQNGADLYARYFDDEDLRDFVAGFADLSARYMLSPKCRQTWYYTFFDVPDRGMVFDPWLFDHADTQGGEGCVHSGWYTRFYPDACAKGYSLTGDRRLLDKAKEFWDCGSKREYQTRRSSAGPGQLNRFAGHEPPKDDTVLEVSRLFYETAHPRDDQQPPSAVSDLSVRLLGGGKAEVRFTAPTDRGGRVVRYQVKASSLPIVPYDPWDPVRDLGAKRPWWRAVNCRDEPAPSRPGTTERFVVSGVPLGQPVYFAVCSFDESSNRSPMSNVAKAEPEP